MKKLIFVLLILLGISAVLYAVETAVFTSLEWRNQEPLIKPVWELVVTGSFDGDDIGNATQIIRLNGIILKVILVVPNTDDDSDCEVEIHDSGGHLIFDSTDLAVGTHTFNLYEPVTGAISVVMGPDVDMDSDDDIVVTLRGI